MSTLVNSEDPDEMLHDAAFHLDLHCLLKLKQPSETLQIPTFSLTKRCIYKKIHYLTFDLGSM